MALDINFVAADVPDQTGRCFLLTGGNAGVGFQVARVLAARNARVILACRNEDKARAAMSRISGEIPEADLSFIPLDQADIESVHRAAELALEEPRLDVLVNNAGVMTSGHETTKQGFEIHFGVNHLGCFALSSLLLPKLAETPAARIVVTSSGLHRRANADWPVGEPASGASGFSNYGTSKLANLLFIAEPTRRLKVAGDPVTAVSSHPGFAPTGLGSGSHFSSGSRCPLRACCSTASRWRHGNVACRDRRGAAGRLLRSQGDGRITWTVVAMRFFPPRSRSIACPGIVGSFHKTDGH